MTIYVLQVSRYEEIFTWFCNDLYNSIVTGLLSHPSLDWLFSLCFCQRCCCNDFCFSHQNHLCLTLYTARVDFGWGNEPYILWKYRFGEMCWMTFLWPWPKVKAVALINKKWLVCMISKKHFFNPDGKSGGNLWAIFFMSFSKSTLAISQEWYGPIDVKWKGSALVGYWVNYMTWTFGLTCNLDLDTFQGQIGK